MAVNEVAEATTALAATPAIPTTPIATVAPVAPAATELTEAAEPTESAKPTESAEPNESRDTIVSTEAAATPAAAAPTPPAEAPLEVPATSTSEAVAELVSNYPGKLLMVVFWSTASEDEAQSFGWINDMHQRYANRGLQVIAVNQDATARDGEAYAVKQGAKFEISHDRSEELRKALWVGKLPATYLLNDAGELLGSHAGFNDDIRGSYEDEIRRLLRTLN